MNNYFNVVVLLSTNKSITSSCFHEFVVFVDRTLGFNFFFFTPTDTIWANKQIEIMLTINYSFAKHI